MKESMNKQTLRDKAQKTWDAACSAYFIGPAGRGSSSANRKYWKAVKIIAAAIEEEITRSNETIEVIAHTRNQAQEFVHLVAEKGSGFLADVAKSLIEKWLKDRPPIDPDPLRYLEGR